ncbi:MAG: hypothetical protein GQ540_03785 [Lutibacter sp.]|uniref:hypothetical protein n=1 Tax=Lutibacter sp. TaxID=1925666 RepID=UPI0019EC3DDE|nr:hypothetical protein [Lutibacter sp.]NOR27634.1 hypothetical protein [Lutibacter sp.]
MSVKEIKNKHGVWLDIEEIVHQYSECQFKQDGFYLNDELLFTWERADEIRKEMNDENNTTIS